MLKSKKILQILRGQTTFYVAPNDIPKSWSELDDAALALQKEPDNAE